MLVQSTQLSSTYFQQRFFFVSKNRKRKNVKPSVVAASTSAVVSSRRPSAAFVSSCSARRHFYSDSGSSNSTKIICLISLRGKNSGRCQLTFHPERGLRLRHLVSPRIRRKRSLAGCERPKRFSTVRICWRRLQLRPSMWSFRGCPRKPCISGPIRGIVAWRCWIDRVLSGHGDELELRGAWEAKFSLKLVTKTTTPRLFHK